MIIFKDLRIFLTHNHSWRIRVLLKSTKIITLGISSCIRHRSSFVFSNNASIQILIITCIYSIIVDEWFISVVIVEIAVCLGVVVFRIERLVNFHIFKLNFKLFSKYSTIIIEINQIYQIISLNKTFDN